MSSRYWSWSTAVGVVGGGVTGICPPASRAKENADTNLGLWRVLGSTDRGVSTARYSSSATSTAPLFLLGAGESLRFSNLVKERERRRASQSREGQRARRRRLTRASTRSRSPRSGRSPPVKERERRRPSQNREGQRSRRRRLTLFLQLQSQIWTCPVLKHLNMFPMTCSTWQSQVQT